MPESYITDAVRAQIGKAGEPKVTEVEKGAIRKFAVAIDDPNPVYVDPEYAKGTKYGGIIAPLGMLNNFAGRPEDWPKLDLVLPQNGALNGGNEFEFGVPIRPGDVITSQTRFAGITERAGSRGLMVMVTMESTLTNQRGENAGKTRITVIYF